MLNGSIPVGPHLLGRWIRRCFLVKVTQSKLEFSALLGFIIYLEKENCHAYKSKKQNDVRYSRLSIRSWIIDDRKDEIRGQK